MKNNFLASPSKLKQINVSLHEKFALIRPPSAGIDKQNEARDNGNASFICCFRGFSRAQVSLLGRHERSHRRGDEQQHVSGFEEGTFGAH